MRFAYVLLFTASFIKQTRLFSLMPPAPAMADSKEWRGPQVSMLSGTTPKGKNEDGLQRKVDRWKDQQVFFRSGLGGPLGAPGWQRKWEGYMGEGFHNVAVMR